MTTIRVFTDGACEGNGKKGAKASYACWFPENKELSASDHVPAEDGQTNQRAEMLAIAEAVRIVQKKFVSSEVNFEIYTDSMYCKDCLTKWLPGWLKNDWKTGKGEPVKHRDLIEETSRNLTKFKSYKITHVAAHTGGSDEYSKHNEIVDKMAVKVLHPEETDEKVILTTNTVGPLPGCPLQLMGPPISEKVIADWCKLNLDKLDSDVLNSALISALAKTVKKNGFEVVKQKLHKTSQYRLVSANHLITSAVTIIREE